MHLAEAGAGTRLLEAFNMETGVMQGDMVTSCSDPFITSPKPDRGGFDRTDG